MNGDAGVLVGLDVGTSAVKAVALRPGAGVVGHEEAPTPTATTIEGGHEHDPELLWQAVAQVSRKLMDRLGRHVDVAAVAVSSMGEAGLPVASDGSPLRPVLGWLDQRTREMPRVWEECVGSDVIFDLTGMALEHSFGLSKLLWIREHEPEVFARTHRWLSVADFVALRLCGEFATDYSLASRTMALDQRQRAWSDRVLGAAGVDARLFPDLAASGTKIGEVTAQAGEVTGLARGAALVLGGHDRLCGAFAARGGSSDAVDSVGTAEALIAVAAAYPGGSPADRSHIPCYCDVVPGQWVFAARVGPAGQLVEWARHGLFADAAYEELAGELKLPLEFSGVVCIPTFGRSATPFWEPPSPYGAFAGLTARHSRAELLQALLEGPAFSLRANLDALAKTTSSEFAVRIEGGLTRIEGWVQMRADVLDREIESVVLPHATAVGAALLAGVGAGVFRDHQEASSNAPLERRRWLPDAGRASRYRHAFDSAYLPLARALPALQRGLTAG